MSVRPACSPTGDGYPREMHGGRGAYPADRAAALSGVPLSTVHYWAREEILVPSVSRERVKLWSYADLMGLRIISWLRKEKPADDGARVRPSSMPAVRRALERLDTLDLDLWTEEAGPSVRVDRTGQILVFSAPSLEDEEGQQVMDDELDVLAPFPSIEGPGGPDLHKPRPKLRIVPGKLGGAPHVIDSRVESQALAALSYAGLPRVTLERLYPALEPAAIAQALDLEEQLTPRVAA